MADQWRDLESFRHRPTQLRPNSVSRRQLFKAAGGLGLVLGSGVWVAAHADEGDGEAARCDKVAGCVSPLPILHITSPPGVHFFFPGPVTGVAVPADPTGAHPGGRDPSTITNFKGFIGEADLNFSGTGTDVKTGVTGTFNFHTDTRFMKGKFIGSDEQEHHGAFAFI